MRRLDFAMPGTERDNKYLRTDLILLLQQSAERAKKGEAAPAMLTMRDDQVYRNKSGKRVYSPKKARTTRCRKRGRKQIFCVLIAW
jgi:hypothetical protein